MNLTHYNKAHCCKFRRHSLYSAARYAFDHEWLDTWEKADK